MFKTFKFVATIAIVLSIISSCGKKEEEKILHMGTSADYPPFEFHQDDKIVGLSVDIAEVVAKRLKTKLEIKDMDFSSLIPALNSGQIDFAISSITANEERRRNLDFSEPYFISKPALIVSKDSTITSMDVLDGKTLGAQFGTIWESFARDKSLSIKDMKVFTATKTLQLIEELKIGRVDAIIIDLEQAARFAQSNPNLKFVELKDKTEGYVIAFQKGSKLVDEFNSELRKLKESGELEAIVNKWTK
jgi:polar amino acid transport system substrate-binding protein